MFYAHIVLAKKGPLARIWLAAHWDKKLTKAHVFETNIEQSVDGIMQPKVKLALRTSGHLLLGVVRIYSRKAKYLLADCNEAFVKIKMAFRPGMVDLPEGHREANVNAITLPEVFHDFDTALPELNDIDIEAQFSVNQSRADEITMREDYGSLSLSLHDDGFGDLGFDGDTPDLMRGGLDPNVDEELFEKELGVDLPDLRNGDKQVSDADMVNTQIDEEGFGDEFGHPELFEGDLFGEPPLAESGERDETLRINEDSEDGANQFDTGAPSPMSSIEYRPPSADRLADFENTVTDKNAENAHMEIPTEEAVANAAEAGDAELDQTTLLRNEDESFALAPIDATAYKGVTKSKRKRKLIVDEIKNISGEEMKAQLANTADIVTTLDLAPPTKRWLMYWKETGGVEKLFALPSRTIPARVLFLIYQRHLVSHFSPLEDFSSLGPADLLAIDNIQPETESPAAVIQNKRGRKRKLDAVQPVPAPAAAAEEQQPNKSAELTNQSLPMPEAVRDAAAVTNNQESLDLGVHNGLNVPTDASLFDAIRSPGQMFSLNPMDQMSVNQLDDASAALPLDNSKEANQSDMSPSKFNDGHMTPHHATIETIDSIPNLPVDQVSSIINEAENMPENADINANNRPCDLATDWNDYDFPPSAGGGLHNVSEEQMENETDEQFEERVLNKRAAQMFYSVKSRINKQDVLMLSHLTLHNTRKQAAQKFYSLLVLKKFRALNISQSEPYAEILVSRGPMFENPKL